MRRWLPLLLAAACGGDGDSARVDAPPTTLADAAVDATPSKADAPPASSSCTLEIAGAASGSFTCEVTALKKDDETTSVFALLSGSGVSSVTMTLRIEGTIDEGAHLADVTNGAVSVMIGGNSYVAIKGSDNDIGSIGNLDITSLEPLPPSGGVMAWVPHGTAAATLVSPTSPGSQITLTATF